MNSYPGDDFEKYHIFITIFLVSTVPGTILFTDLIYLFW